MNWEPLVLTFELATVTTIFLLVISIPLGYLLAFSKFRIKPVIEALISMPLVLPPTVLGFYFLLAFSPNNAFGSWLDEWLLGKLVARTLDETVLAEGIRQANQVRRSLRQLRERVYSAAGAPLPALRLSLRHRAAHRGS